LGAWTLWIFFLVSWLQNLQENRPAKVTNADPMLASVYGITYLRQTDLYGSMGLKGTLSTMPDQHRSKF